MKLKPECRAVLVSEGDRQNLYDVFIASEMFKAYFFDASETWDQSPHSIRVTELENGGCAVKPNNYSAIRLNCNSRERAMNLIGYEVER